MSVFTCMHDNNFAIDKMSFSEVILCLFFKDHLSVLI